MKTKKSNWIVEGLVFGIFMLVFSIIIERITGELNFEGYWKKIILWMVGGLLYGLAMRFVRGQDKE